VKIPLIRQGEGPAAALERARSEQEALRAKIDRISRESDSEHIDERAPGRGTAGGDTRKLRGIPAIGRGVSGAIPGTSPHGIR
jgi:hypothetical protein